MRVSALQGTSPTVDKAVRVLEFQLFARLARAHADAHYRLGAVSEDSDSENQRADAAITIWGAYTQELACAYCALFDSIAEIGFAHPEYAAEGPAKWAEDFLRPHISDLLEYVEGGILSKYLGLRTSDLVPWEEALTDFWVEINQSLWDRSVAVIVSAAKRGGETTFARPKAAPTNDAAESYQKSTVEQRAFVLEEKPAYTLLDLEDSPAGVSRCDVVRDLYPTILNAVKEFRTWSKAHSSPNQVSDKDITNRFPIFRAATPEELSRLSGRSAPSICALEIIQLRTALAFDTVKKYASQKRS